MLRSVAVVGGSAANGGRHTASPTLSPTPRRGAQGDGWGRVSREVYRVPQFSSVDLG